MVISPAARQQLLSLINHYERLGRSEAVDNLRAAVDRVRVRIDTNQVLHADAPRPYPDLAGLGLRWTKQGAYWFGFRLLPGSARLQAVFHESADIPNRV